MNQRRRPPSMEDVAAVARVSHQTVSRVLNAHPSVRPETRQRVLDAVRELGYRRNNAARALVTRRTGAIGVLTTGSDLYGPMRTLVALAEAARAAGFVVIVATPSRFDPDTVGAVLEHVLAQGVEGIVAIAPHDAVAAAVDLFVAPLPVVMVSARHTHDSPADGDGLEVRAARTIGVSVDQQLAARLATEHLLSLGHSTVTHLGGPLDWFDAREREAGWSKALREAGALVPDVVRCDWSADRGFEEGAHIAERVRAGDGPTAVFAANDQLALGLLHACAEAGVDVPGQLSVVGVDDVQGAAHFVPPLTTVRQPFDELGRQALRVLVRELEPGGGAIERDLIRPQLVVRRSSGPPR